MDRSARDFLIVLLGIPILRMLVVIPGQISKILIVRRVVVASRLEFKLQLVLLVVTNNSAAPELQAEA